MLALGIVVQGLIFLGAQATGISSLFTEGCSVIAQFVFPGMIRHSIRRVNPLLTRESYLSGSLHSDRLWYRVCHPIGPQGRIFGTRKVRRVYMPCDYCFDARCYFNTNTCSTGN